MWIQYVDPSQLQHQQQQHPEGAWLWALSRVLKNNPFERSPGPFSYQPLQQQCSVLCLGRFYHVHICTLQNIHRPPTHTRSWVYLLCSYDDVFFRLSSTPCGGTGRRDRVVLSVRWDADVVLRETDALRNDAYDATVLTPYVMACRHVVLTFSSLPC